MADFRVVAAGTGTPVADATAWLDFPRSRIACGDFEDPVDLGWHADSDGRLRFPVPEDGDFTICVHAPGLSGRNVHSVRDDIELRPLGSIAGRVRFADGTPAAGVRVEAATGWADEAPRDERAAVTGADGRFRIDGLASAVHHVLVEAGSGPSITPLRRDVDVPDESLDLVVTGAPAIEGRVVDVRGRPVFDVEVRARPTDKGPDMETRTDADGRFRLAGAGAGKYDVEVGEFGYPFGTTKGAVAGKEIVMRAELGYKIAGRVLDGAGRPRTGCVVSAKGHRTRTDASGRFVIDDIEGGLWDLEVDYRSPDSGGKRIRAGTTDVILVAR
jgi:hypothetical protein